MDKYTNYLIHFLEMTKELIDTEDAHVDLNNLIDFVKKDTEESAPMKIKLLGEILKNVSVAVTVLEMMKGDKNDA